LREGEAGALPIFHREAGGEDRLERARPKKMQLPIF
jgi:hypothetical protein